MKKNKGITLIALVVTIIVLVILSGVSINLTLKNNGIVKKSQEASLDYEKAKLKEELEIAILNIKMEKTSKNTEMTRQDLMELDKIGAIIESIEIPAEGEYKDYFFEIDENYEVTIIGKLKGEKPTIEAEVMTTEIVNQGETVEIKIMTSINEGTITEIIAPDGAILKTEASATEKVFEVSANGIYIFKTKADNGRTSIIRVEVNNIYEKPQIEIKDKTQSSFKIAVTNNYKDGLVTEYKYYVNGELKSSGTTDKEYELTELSTGDYTNIYVEAYFGENKLTSESTTVILGKEGKLVDIIDGTDYGKNINYQVTVNGKTLSKNDWKIFYNDGKNVYIILSGYLDNSLIPSQCKMTKSGTDCAYWAKDSGITTGSQAASMLTNTTYWSEFAKGKEGAVAMGGPSGAMFVNSWNQNPKTNSKKITVGVRQDQTLTDTTELYYPRIRTSTNGYWLTNVGPSGYSTCLWTAMINITNPYWKASYWYSAVSSTYVSIRPVVCLPATTTGTVASSVEMN